MTAKQLVQEKINELGFVVGFDGSIIVEDTFDANIIVDLMEKYAVYQQIEENMSMLEMAKLHMDSRAVMVLEDRLNTLQLKTL